jgi:hypothetical protein
MKFRALSLFAPVLLSGCLTTAPSAQPAVTATEAPGNLLPSSSAAVVSEGMPETTPAGPLAATSVAIEPPAEPVAVTPETPAPAVETNQTPQLPGAGRIVRVNTKLHYVLLDVSGRLHAGQDVVVFREGEAVGRLRISAPRQGRYASADILDGDVREGDLVK